MAYQTEVPEILQVYMLEKHSNKRKSSLFLSVHAKII